MKQRIILVMTDAVCSIDAPVKLQIHSENKSSVSGICEQEIVNWKIAGTLVSWLLKTFTSQKAFF